jgi:hypothetical protein
MHRFLFVAIFSVVSFDASAMVRYMVEGMSCADMHEALERDGRAIFYRRGKTGVTLYDRFVKDESLCPAGYTGTTEHIEAADTDACRVTKCIEARRFGG